MMGLAAALASPATGQSTNTNTTATVIFNLRTMAGLAQVRSLTLTPIYDPLADEGDMNIFWGAPLTAYPTNPVAGVATLKLAPNGYTVTMTGAPGSFTIWVTDAMVGQTNYAPALSTNLLSVGYVPGASTNMAVVAGTNVTVVTNGATFTVSSSGSGGGGTTNVLFTTDQKTNQAGYLALSGDYGVAVGGHANGSARGTAVGLYSSGTNYGVGIGQSAIGDGMGNVAVGGMGTDYGNAAVIPNGWTDTVELGHGAAVLQGGLNFRGFAVANSNGWLVAPITLTVLTNSVAPTNASTVRAWVNVTNQPDGRVFKLPLYQ